MTKFATFDDVGLPTGFYDALDHGRQWRQDEDGRYHVEKESMVPEDSVEITDEQWREFLLHQGERRWNGKTVEEFKAAAPPLDLAHEVQTRLDAKARERHYDSIASAIGYRGDRNPIFAAEAEALFNWRSAVWTVVTSETEKAKTKHRSPDVAKILAHLPAFEWPN